MKNYPISELTPGMVVGRSVYSNHGQLILEADTILTEKLISRLGFYGIYNVLVKLDSVPVEPAETETKTSQPTHIERTQSHAAKLQLNPNFIGLQVNYTKCVVTLKSFLTTITENPAPMKEAKQLLKEVNYLEQHFQSPVDLFDMLHNMRQLNDSIYAHSLNVALIAKTLGKWLDFSQEKIDTLTLCGLLHDIGKTLLPEELLNKPDKYTPEEFSRVKKHPALGYQLLMDKDLDLQIKNVILMHHERCDGSGYPQGLKLEQLSEYTMIIAIADVFDAMTMTRSYREPLCPFQVIAAFETEGLQKYHPKYILTFLEHIADFYQHNRVLLNNGQSGIIAMINKHHLTQPYLQFDDGKILDMTTRNDLEIVAIL